MVPFDSDFEFHQEPPCHSDHSQSYFNEYEPYAEERQCFERQSFYSEDSREFRYIPEPDYPQIPNSNPLIADEDAEFEHDLHDVGSLSSHEAYFMDLHHYLEEFSCPLSLERRESTAMYTTTQAEDEPCVVCQCEIEKGEKIMVLSCLHKFHQSCLEPWLAQRNTCPTCKVEI